MKKFFAIMILACICTVAMAATAFAGNWEGSYEAGWRWNKGNNNYAVNEWLWIDADNDGRSFCYYFGPNAICALNTVIDGFAVNGTGEWTEGGVPQIKIGNGPGGADSKASNSANVAKTTLEDYAARLTYTGVDGTEQCRISTKGDEIIFDVTIAQKSTEITPKEVKDKYWGDDHYRVMQIMANDLLGFYGASRLITENVYSSDGVLMFTYTYHGTPYAAMK